MVDLFNPRNETRADVFGRLQHRGYTPRYGKYGGLGWTGGKWGGVPGPEPDDMLDGFFMDHDIAYGRAKSLSDIITADQQLVNRLKNYLGQQMYNADFALQSVTARLEARTYADRDNGSARCKQCN